MYQHRSYMGYICQPDGSPRHLFYLLEMQPPHGVHRICQSERISYLHTGASHALRCTTSKLNLARVPALQVRCWQFDLCHQKD